MREAPHHGGPTRVTVAMGRDLAYGHLVRADAEHSDVRVLVAFEPSSAPSLAVGRAVDVAFHGGGAASGLELRGRVVGRWEDHAGARYELFFPRAANGGVGALVDRRGALRVEPDPDAPVPVRLQAWSSQEVLELLAVDLSASGIALRVPPFLEAGLTTTRRVRLEVSLPGDPVPVALEGTILRRRLEGAFVHYGIRFSERGTEAERERLLQWVLAKHQRDLLVRSGPGRTARAPRGRTADGSSAR